MNIYLLQVVGKWISVLFMTVITIFGGFFYQEEDYVAYNEAEQKTLNIKNKAIPYETITTYNSKLPSNVSRVTTPGVDGIVSYDALGNEIILQAMVKQVVEQGSGDYGIYKGRMTGYGADCVGCSPVGNVACFTKNGTKHSLTYDGEYYQDDEFGKVRILSAARAKFPCGTMILVDNGSMEPFYGVVLDTGGSMIQAWNEGVVWMDLAFKTQAEARNAKATSRNVTYKVQRWGW